MNYAFTLQKTKEANVSQIIRLDINIIMNLVIIMDLQNIAVSFSDNKLFTHYIHKLKEATNIFFVI